MATTRSSTPASARDSPTRSAASRRFRGDVARRLLPLVADEGWFFDTELLLLAERNGLRIHEVPVDWVEDLDSRVDLSADDRRPTCAASPASAAPSGAATGYAPIVRGSRRRS